MHQLQKTNNLKLNFFQLGFERTIKNSGYKPNAKITKTHPT
jgi:hypothetical protein